MRFVEGFDRDQMMLLPPCAEDYVGAENPVRVIDAFVDGLDMQELGFSNAEPNDTGRPRYDQRDLLKLAIYGYMNRVRSSRRLEAETHRNLEVIWLIRGLTPDHKTIARLRQFNFDALKQVFRQFVIICNNWGMYGEECGIDGSKFKAVNSKKRNLTAAKIAKRIAELDESIAKYMTMLEQSDKEEEVQEDGKTAEEISEIIESLRDRKSTYAGYENQLNQTNETQLSWVTMSRLRPTVSTV